MGYDFPSSGLTIGQIANNGSLSFRWDGAKWMPAGGGGGSGGGGGTPSDALPAMDGTAAAGTATAYSRGDHVHPTDASRYAASNPSGYQTAAQVAAVVPVASNALPLVEGTAAAGSAATFARGDHVHPAAAGSAAAVSNLLHNGQWLVRQRGVGPWTTGQYTADRWVLVIASDIVSFAIQALADFDRTAIGDEAATHRMTCNVTGNSAAGAYTVLQQYIEDARRLSGKTVTVSFWAAASLSNFKIGVSFDQIFGVGGSPSAPVTGAGQAVTLTQTWARYSVTLNVPSTSGKTFGTTPNTSATALNLWFSSGSTNATRAGNIGVQTAVFTLWGVQVEFGSTATPLAKRDPADELALCQRFFETSYNTTIGAFSLNAGESFGMSHPTASFRAFVPFKVKKRVNPTVTVYDAVGTSNACSYYTNTWLNGGAVFLQTGSQSGIYAGSGIASAIETQFGWTASADF